MKFYISHKQIKRQQHLTHSFLWYNIEKNQMKVFHWVAPLTCNKQLQFHFLVRFVLFWETLVLLLLPLERFDPPWPTLLIDLLLQLRVLLLSAALATLSLNIPRVLWALTGCLFRYTIFGRRPQTALLSWSSLMLLWIEFPRRLRALSELKLATSWPNAFAVVILLKLKSRTVSFNSLCSPSTSLILFPTRYSSLISVQLDKPSKPHNAM